MSVSLREAVSKERQVPIVRNCDKYLGLLTFVWKNKRQGFGFIWDWVWQKIKSWECFKFSKVGKRFLLKLCFKLSLPILKVCSSFRVNCVIDELNSLIANFWWGSSSNGKKLHRLSWRKLCASKFEGGIGFKSIGEFNQAMVEKQVWRIIQNPNSLLTRISIIIQDISFLLRWDQVPLLLGVVWCGLGTFLLRGWDGEWAMVPL